MATGDQVYQTSITINGKIDERLLKSLQELDTGTGKVVKQEKELGKESKKSFDLFGKGAAVATAKTKEFSIALKDMMLPLLGISVAFKGFETVGATIQTAIDKFRGAKEAAANFQASLEALFDRARASRVEEFDVAQQARMKERFTGIYGVGLFREAQLELNRAGIALGDEAFAGFIQTTAYLKRSLKITAEDATTLARRIGMAYALPKGARPDKEILEMLHSMNINIDKFMKLSGPEKLRLIVAGMKNMHYIQERIGDAREKDNVELMRAQTTETGLLVRIGEFWEKLQTKGELVTQHLKNAFEIPFVTASEQIQKLLEGPLTDLDKRIAVLNTAFRQIFNPSEADVTAGFRKLDSPEALFGNLTRAWRETILPQMERDWTNFTRWVSEQWTTLGRADNPFLKGLHDNMEAIGKAIAQFATISWDKMAAAALSIGEAAQHLNDAVNAITGAMGALKDAITTSPKVLTPPIATPPPKPGEAPAPEVPWFGYGFAEGGIVNAPQVGLVGESGPESIVPLKQDANTLGILEATLSNLRINPFDPNAYGHEMFDAMRAQFGLAAGAGAGGPPGFTGNVGGVFYTEYGPTIDPPGSPDYDYNSYHRIGAWPAITGPLQPGDVALGHGAQAFYGVSPGQTFTDTRGNTVRFADRSGSKNPMNEDVFRLASGGIVSKRILSWLGEAGREAVIPLEGGRGKRALAGALGGGAGHSFHFAPNISMSGVATAEIVEDLVEQLRNNFSRWIEDAHFEHQRRSFS